MFGMELDFSLKCYYCFYAIGQRQRHTLLRRCWRSTGNAASQSSPRSVSSGVEEAVTITSAQVVDP